MKKFTPSYPNEPVLTMLKVDIGGMFFLDNIIWIRTGRTSAKSKEFGSCYFGTYEDSEERQKEWDDVLKNSVVLDSKKVANLIRDNINLVKEVNK